jgi:hypothetical protein
MILRLPLEIQIQIIRFLDLQSLINLCSTNRWFYLIHTAKFRIISVMMKDHRIELPIVPRIDKDVLVIGYRGYLKLYRYLYSHQNVFQQIQIVTILYNSEYHTLSNLMPLSLPTIFIDTSDQRVFTRMLLQ